LQIAYQQPGNTQKFGISPDIQWFDEWERLAKKVETIFQPQYLVEPPNMEGNLEGRRKI
jgi:hypothetical protein